MPGARLIAAFEDYDEASGDDSSRDGLGDTTPGKAYDDKAKNSVKRSLYRWRSTTAQSRIMNLSSRDGLGCGARGSSGGWR